MTTKTILFTIPCLILLIGCAAAERWVNEYDPSAAGAGGSSSTSTTNATTGGNLGNGGNGGSGQAKICDVVDAVQPCYGSEQAYAGVGACVLGTQTCVLVTEGEIPLLTWSACNDWVAPSAELCGDGVDNDCDGVTDNGCVIEDNPCAVGRAAEIKCGKLFVWGDEHVHFSDYLPENMAFWNNAIGWLKKGSCAADRTNVRFIGFNFDELAASLNASGFNVSQFGSFDNLGPADIVVVKPFQSDVAQGAALKTWVEAGGALMVMTVGFGSGQDECDNANPLLTPFGITYSCFEPAPWGPVSSFGAHPIAAGLAPNNAPFVNGRFVVASPNVPNLVVANVEGVCPMGL